MNKTWLNNNLGMLGKWGGGSFLFGMVVTAFVFGFGENIPLRAYVSDVIPASSYQPSTEFKFDLNSPVSKINDVTAPVNNLINDAIKGLRFNQSINIGTGTPLSPIKTPSQGIDFNKFFGSSKVSSNDLTSFLKEAAVTGINLSILIISITTQVLQGLLRAIK